MAKKKAKKIALRKVVKPKKQAKKKPVKVKKAIKAPKPSKQVKMKRKATSIVKTEPKQKLPKPAKAPKRESYADTGIYEETSIICPGCGRTSKVIKIAGLATEGMLCQRCVKGDIELEEMDF